MLRARVAAPVPRTSAARARRPAHSLGGMTELLVVLTGLVLLLTVLGVVVLGRDRLAERAGPARDGIAVGRAPAPPLVMPEHPTAQDVERIAFTVRRRGYDPAEVHAVLAYLADRLPPPEEPPSRPVPGA